MALYATPTDVADRFEGQLSTEQLVWVAIKIDDAESLLLTRIPRLSNVELASALDLKNAKRVIAEAVLRVLRNTGGFRTEAHGPFSGTRSDMTASGQLFFTNEELGAFKQTQRRRAGVIGIAPPSWGEI
nr:hypothetical protein [Rhodococcus sp. (in: high G+C Gram-positive bacteria)]